GAMPAPPGGTGGSGGTSEPLSEETAGVGPSAGAPSRAESGGSAGLAGRAGTSGAAGAPLSAGTGGITAAGSGGAAGAAGSPMRAHRPEAVTCSRNYLDPATSCMSDADCTIAETIGSPAVTARCTGGQCSADACLTDHDCGMGSVCSCKDQTFGYGHTSFGNSCIEGDCNIDADCSSGECAPSIAFDSGPFYGIRGYYCRTPDDTCATDADCDARGSCAFDPTAGIWACSYTLIAG
ncbi:MAG TPA: hypothetical protein VGQ57_03795, partial [Polyangiaceae bacterium]|nr:hypothetical protein [Polyangiaceae bacterium]